MLIHRNFGCRTFGVAWYRIATAATTSATMTGHFAMFQTVTVTSLRPTAAPTERAMPPDSTTAATITTAMTTRISVTSSSTGRSFQNGRPSSTS